ncbi:hypothetical protein E2I00_001331 [Balaenoptera physalus]|uniref:Protein phosphatase 1 regulatory subunit 14 n=1 Tax=Balaenoptera physalus TaxID=9770 RepID=A0A6A1Q6L3_BALPH|nr:hypothetical protein E2I00_001331 [Balaenoptera physalus]
MLDSRPAGGTALVVLAPKLGSGSVCFQSPPGAAGEGPVRCQGKVTVKYDLEELRKRLNLEEWILEQLPGLYNYQEGEILELEIAVDELLDVETDETQLPGSRSCWWTVTNPLRPPSLACWTRSRTCRSRAHPGRKEGSPTQVNSGSTGQPLPPDLIATAILGGPAARPGATSGAPRASGPEVSSQTLKKKR